MAHEVVPPTRHEKDISEPVIAEERIPNSPISHRIRMLLCEHGISVTVSAEATCAAPLQLVPVPCHSYRVLGKLVERVCYLGSFNPDYTFLCDKLENFTRLK